MKKVHTGGLIAVAAAAAGAVGVQRRAAPGGIDTADLTGKSAVVTGAGSGIGRALAVLLAQRGATVHLADRDGVSATAVADQIDPTGKKALIYQVDVADGDAVNRFADAVFDLGGVDLLFNNAGVGHAGAAADMSIGQWRRLVEINLMGVVHGVHAFLPRLIAQGRPAHIVNTASMAGLVPNPGLTAYTATKSAVIGLSLALDMELTGSGIRVAAICPGIINTAIVATSTMSEAAASGRGKMIDFYAKRGTSPDVVARQTLAAITRGRSIVPTPRYQVMPHWLLQRMLPPAARTMSLATYRWMNRSD